MILKKIQRQIEGIYRFALNYNVESFLTSGKNVKEALIIKSCPEHVEVALFLEKPILTQLKKHDPFFELDRNNINAFCTAVEGVSHFLYFVKRAEENQPVSQLELELQAEIDKYLLACLLYYHHHHSIPEFLFSHLFENFNWKNSLNETEKNRYKEANRLATKFCAHLESNYLRHGYWRSALETARHFYHLNHWDKIRTLTP